MVFSKLCHGPSASGDKGISLAPQKSARGKFHQIGNEKRACVYELSRQLPSSRLLPESWKVSTVSAESDTLSGQDALPFPGWLAPLHAKARTPQERKFRLLIRLS